MTVRLSEAAPPAGSEPTLLPFRVPADGQAVFLGLYGSPGVPVDSVIDTIRRTLETTPLGQKLWHRKARDLGGFFAQLATMHRGELQTMVDLVSRAGCLPLWEAMGRDGLPCVHTLRRVGLIAVPGPVVWGLCIVVNSSADGGGQHYVMPMDRPNDTTSMPPTEMSLAEMELELTNAVQQILTPPRSRCGEGAEKRTRRDLANRASVVAQMLATATGWRHVRLQAQDWRPIDLHEIPREDLLDGLREGSLDDLFFEGVNAPEPAQG